MNKYILILIALFIALPVKAQEISSQIEPISEPVLSPTIVDELPDNSKIESVRAFPYLKMEKWNKELNLGISAEDMLSFSPAIENGNKLIYSKADKDIEIIRLSPSEKNEGGFEINIVLKEKPNSNVFRYEMDNWNDLDFFYQPPLWQEKGLKEATKDCTDTDCDNRHRPLEIVGSYAVYYKGHSGHAIGGIDYKTGKAFHIYRPLVTDSSGAKVWGTLSYENGILYVTVPQEFLDKASYPVIIDPTFGNSSIGLSTSIGNQNSVSKVTNSSGIGNLVSISFYGLIQSGTPKFDPALYSDNAGVPNSLLAGVNTGGTAFTGSPSWITTSISYSGLSNTDYWLGWKDDTGASNNLIYYYDYAVGERYPAESPGGDWESTYLTGGGAQDERVSIYATFTVPMPPTISGSGGDDESIITNK